MKEVDQRTVTTRIQREVEDHPVVVFMKGTPMFPRCASSAAVVEILSRLGIEFKAVDVLTDRALRDGIKVFSDWPTLPQLYVKGEFVGGCDIVREMLESGELRLLFESKGIAFKD